MNWDAIGAVGELLGSVAVLVTLVYLAIQVRHARAETRLLLSQGRLQANREGLAIELDAPNFDARMKVQAALDSEHPAVDHLRQRTGLTREEAWRVFNCEIMWWNYRIHMITHIDELPPAERRVFEAATRIRYTGASPSALLYHGFLREFAHPDVARYIDARIVEANEASTPRRDA